MGSQAFNWGALPLAPNNSVPKVAVPKPPGAPAFDWDSLPLAKASPAATEAPKAAPGILDEANQAMADSPSDPGWERALKGIGRTTVGAVTGVVQALDPRPRNIADRVQTGLPTSLGGGYVGMVGRRLLADPSIAMNRHLDQIGAGQENKGPRRLLKALSDIPLFGPTGVHMAEEYVNGDKAGMAGEAAGLLAGPKLAEYAGDGLKAVAPAYINRAVLRATPAQFRFGKNPGAALLEEKIAAPNMSGVLRRAAARASDLTRQINAATAAASGPRPFPAGMAARSDVDLSPVVKIIDDRIASATRRQSPDLVSSLRKLRGRLTNDFETQQPRLSLTVDPATANEIKRGLAEEGAFNSATSRPYRLAARAATQKLSRGVEGAVPAIAPLNKRLASLIEAEKAARKRVEAGMARPGLMDMMAGAGTGAASIFLNRGDPLRAIAESLGGYGLYRGATSAPIGISAARGMDAAGRIMPRLGEGIFAAVPGALTKKEPK